MTKYGTLIACLALSACASGPPDYLNMKPRPSAFDEALWHMCGAEPGSPFCRRTSPVVTECADGSTCVKMDEQRPAKVKRSARRQRV